MKTLQALTFVLLTISCAEISAVPNKIICYYASGAASRPDAGSYTIEDIDPHICTHLYYAFGGVNADGTVNVNDWDGDVNNGGYVRFNGLKARNPSLKTLLSLGGWDDYSSAIFSGIAADAELRDIFAANVARFLLDYGFDGVDIDWEYPAQRGGSADDYVSFVELLWALRAQLDSYGFLLTAAVGATVSFTSISYDLNRIQQVVDWVNIMTYDYHGTWETVTGANAPLFSRLADSDQNANVDASVQQWLDLSYPPEKLVLGIGAYGHSWTLANNDDHGIGSPASGAGTPGPYTGEAGTLSYTEICLQDWTYGWDNEQIIVYAYRDDQWVSFDNPDSLGYKADYAVAYNLGGFAIWSLDLEDVYGLCGSTYPLINTLRSHIGWQ